MLEQQWSDSTDTVKGTAEHKNVHSADIVFRDGKYTITELQVFSKQLELVGKCDAVEAVPDDSGVLLPFIDEKCILFPIEYKHGKLRNEEEYELQLCAQAMCLEEMYSLEISCGAVFYINSHRRKEVTFDDKMRKKVVNTVSSLQAMLDSKITPRVESSAKCLRCSLKDICMPDVSASVQEYMKAMKKDIWRCDE